MSRIITLTTDFGTRDAYVGTMKGVILTIAPDVTLVDITHQIAPQDVRQGAFRFASSVQYFPSDTIHVVVVDPGVGSARRPIALRVGETVFIGPDNGVLTPAVQACLAAQPEALLLAIHLDRPEFWLPAVSQTFHGRDIFAPCAAHLARGIPFESLGGPIDDWIRLASAAPTYRADGSIVAHVQDIDGFGNIILDVSDEILRGADRSHISITLGGRSVRGVRRAYADVPPGELVALVGSTGYLEVALREGNAARDCAIRTGDEALVVP